MKESEIKEILAEAYDQYCMLEQEQGENPLSFSGWLERFYSEGHE